jgi:hypothetical protein
MEPLRFQNGDDYFEEHSSRLAPGTKKRAEENHRSLNREVLATLRSATNQSRRIEPAALIREAQAVRKKFRRRVSPAQIRAWIRRGRP